MFGNLLNVFPQSIVFHWASRGRVACKAFRHIYIHNKTPSLPVRLHLATTCLSLRNLYFVWIVFIPDLLQRDYAHPLRINYSLSRDSWPWHDLDKFMVNTGCFVHPSFHQEIPLPLFSEVAIFSHDPNISLPQSALIRTLVKSTGPHFRVSEPSWAKKPLPRKSWTWNLRDCPDNLSSETEVVKYKTWGCSAFARESPPVKRIAFKCKENHR